MSNHQQTNKLWAEIDRIQRLLKQIETEAEILNVDIKNDKLYISLQAYIAGLRFGDSLN
jgi:hypothetical protein